MNGLERLPGHFWFLYFFVGSSMARNNSETIFGMHVIETILKRHPERMLELFVHKERGDERLVKLAMQATRFGVHVKEVSKAEINKMAGTSNHQGVVARIRAPAVLREPELLELVDDLQAQDTKPFFLILDTVTDPHNLGACIRSADAAGVHGVIAPKDKSVGINATVRKVASGSAEIVPFFQVTNLARTMKELQNKGIWCVGSVLSPSAKSIYDTDLNGALAMVMGAEGTGLRRLTAETCDNLVYIPMRGEVASLNVSVATGVCLFEALRQRGL